MTPRATPPPSPTAFRGGKPTNDQKEDEMTAYDQDRYGKAEHLHGEHEYSEALEELAGLAETAKVNLPGLDIALDKVSKSNAIQREFRQHRERPEDAAARVARSLVAGELDLDGAARDLVLVEAMESNSLLAKAVKRTAAKIPSAAFREFQKSLDPDQVLEEARKSAAEARGAIVKLRPTLDGVRDAEQATSAGSKVASAWAKYKSDLLPRWEAAQKLVSRLRDFHLVPPLSLDVRRAARLGRIDLATADNKAAKRAGAPILELLDPCCDEWLPTGPHTQEEAEGFADLLEAAEQGDEKREAEISQRFGSGQRGRGKVHVG